MPRYFLQLSYKGTKYSGFQVQENAKTIQSEVEHALQVFYRQPFQLTGSSRTDSGVHALQNYFHFDTDLPIASRDIYNLNSILPPDIAATGIYRVAADAHSRFGATAREYKYFIYNKKNPFLYDRAWYYPYKIDENLLDEAAQLLQDQQDFVAFSKRNTQVNNFICRLEHSHWSHEDGCLVFTVKANRFLRGMVRAMVSTMLKLGRKTLSMTDFQSILKGGSQSSASFAAPSHGLFLVEVQYPPGYMQDL